MSGRQGLSSSTSRTDSVTLCTVLVELSEEEEVIESLHYLAPKYRGKKEMEELQFGTGEKKKTRGFRQLTSMSVETFKADQEDKVVPFSSGNPFVEVTKGIVHLYKENERTPIDADGARSEMLLMLAVPAIVSCRDLLQFVAPFHQDIEHIKIIRDSMPNQYMALIKMKSLRAADAVYKTLNGTTFNSIEDDMCNLAYVSRVETMKESGNVGLPLVGHTELPTCPVCLERMDESVDGVLTILCNHSFHSICLSKWSDARCPVCRFVQTPELTQGNECFECKSAESLWICLICGHIGCGRYIGGHAYKHFCETSHCYAIQPDNNRVWDYVGDNFVHRLLQNKDGKLVEVGGRDTRADESCGGDADSEEKLESVQLEFTYLLTTQLESQRFFFEERLAMQRREMESELEKVRAQVDEINANKAKTEGNLNTVVKEKNALDRKITSLTQKLSKATADLNEEKELNKVMKEDHAKWKAMYTQLQLEHERYKKQTTDEINELKESLRDVMFFMEAQQKIQESPYKDEAAEGHVVVPTPATTLAKKDKKKQKR